MKKFLKDNWLILLLEILVITAFTVFYGKFGSIMVDSYREIYIPQQMLEGKVLYKDIFVIYPPLAYFINAVLIKITNNGLNTLLFSGLFSTLGIIFLTYRISKMFTNDFGAFAICLFIISSLILSPNVFNSFLPYSYGILYGILFTLLALYLALRKKYPLTYLFYSLAILCKYEFALLLPLLIVFTGKNNLGKNILTLCLPIFLTLSFLILQGLNLNDINANIEILDLISSSKTLYWFYSVMGLTFRIELIPIYIASFIKFCIPIFLFRYQENLIWSFPIIFIGFLFRFKKLQKKEIFFIIASLLASIKVFFALTLQSYGAYFLPFALISLMILLPEKIKKIFAILLIIWSLLIGGFNVKNLTQKETELNIITNYIKTNTKPSDTVLVYPECLYVNIKAERKSDNKLYSLIPLYIETFGEDLVIKRLSLLKPEFIVINNYDTSDYYYKEFGNDYAKNIVKWIQENYNLVTIIEDKWIFKVYKLK